MHTYEITLLFAVQANYISSEHVHTYEITLPFAVQVSYIIWLDSSVHSDDICPDLKQKKIYLQACILVVKDLNIPVEPIIKLGATDAEYICRRKEQKRKKKKESTEKFRFMH